jgi:hypothetical protein
MELVKGLSTDAEREQMWSNVASAAETGWDFRFILFINIAFLTSKRSFHFYDKKLPTKNSVLDGLRRMVRACMTLNQFVHGQLFPLT